MRGQRLWTLRNGMFDVILLSCIFLLKTNGAFAATSAIDEINITIPASCSLSSTVDSAHVGTVETGIYQEDIGETTFKVFCNDSEGFAVYAVGYTNDEFGNNTLKPAVVDNSNAVATGTATSGNTSNWAMKLSAISGTYAPTIHSTEENSNTYSFTSYHTIPSEYTKVASYSSNTDVTTGSSFKSTYAAFISQTQLADSYTGKVKYTVVHPSSELAPIENIAQLTYMQDFKDLKADERTAVLNSMQYNTTYNLIDSRDNKTYQIARLKDDNIWMAENLDLGRTELTQDLTSQNTNLSTNANTVTASDFNSWIKTSGTASYISGELIALSTSNSSDSFDTDSASNTPYGTLYNYCAASAGTICTDSANGDAVSDICPAGWRLPTGGNSGEFKALYSLTDYNTNDAMRAPITEDGAAFALAGNFYSSTPTYQGSSSGYWSSTWNNSLRMYRPSFSTSHVSPADYDNRRYGFSVRCIAKRPSRALTVSYGTGVSSVQLNGITIQNGGVVNLEEGVSYTIIVTPTEGYALSDWTSSSGSIGSNASETTTYTIGSDNATLTANAMLAIQNLDSSNCTSTASQVVDNRDAHIYTIQRLADGRCWMMENLDLGHTTLTKDLTSANTNLTNTVTKTTFNGWRKTQGSQSYVVGDYIPIDSIDSISETPYGTLYNYYAASAGTISSNSSYDDAKFDICPSRWRLPTGGNLGEFQTLYSNSAYNTYEKMIAPISSNGAAFAKAGSFYISSSYQGTFGYYWTSTSSAASMRYILSLNNSSIDATSSTSNQRFGYSIRCILDETSISDLTYMQDFNSLSHAAKTSVYDTMTDNTIYNLIDNRDNKLYQIARLKDGNIWMAENLDLGRAELTQDLTNTNTNLSTTITASEFNGWKKASGYQSYDEGVFVSINGNDSASGTPYGTLYNYHATSAGTITGNSNSRDAAYDICPAGWRLPTGGASGEFDTLYRIPSYNSVANMRAPISNGGVAFTLAGRFDGNNGNYHDQETYGNYWSSGYYSSLFMKNLCLQTSSVSASTVDQRYYGFSIRCVAK